MVAPYNSALLLHGPGAKQQAHDLVGFLGRLLHPPFGEDGLKIAEAREIQELMEGTPLGTQPGVLVLGPMDRAWPAASDALLKTLEEFDPIVFRPVLWAHDLGGVRGTIRSRCLHRWCPGEEPDVDVDLWEQVRVVVDASLKGNRARVLEGIRELGEAEGVLEIAVQVLRKRASMGLAELCLWGRLREALRVHNPSNLEIRAVFL